MVEFEPLHILEVGTRGQVQSLHHIQEILLRLARYWSMSLRWTLFLVSLAGSDTAEC